jgi:two-component system, response regulator YesN
MLKCIIVDDEQREIDGILKYIDFNSLRIQYCGCANTAIEGIELAKRVNPDIILSDICMPMYDGLYMAGKIMELLKEPNFIFLSCYDDFNYAKQSLIFNTFAYLLKPMDYNELEEHLKKLVEKIEAAQAQNNYFAALQEQMMKNLNIIQETVIFNFLNGTADYSNEDQIFLNINLNEQSRCLLVYQRIGVENNQHMVTNWLFHEYRLKQLNEDHLLSRYEGFSVVIDTKSICTLINLSNQADFDEGIEILSQIKELFTKDHPAHVSTIISKECVGIESLPQMFNELVQIQEEHIFSDQNRIMFASEIVGEDRNRVDYFDLKKQIKSIIENPQDISEFLDQLLSHNIMDINEAKQIALYIYFTVETIIMEKGLRIDTIIDDYQDILPNLFNCQTLEGFCRILEDLLTKVQYYIGNKTSSRQRIYVENIKKVINEQYTTIENVNDIADQIFISPSYAHQVFKLETGLTIYDYLFDIRMKKAEELLKDSNIKIYEVSEKVGYKNKSYFTLTFREYSGLSPKQFREKYAEK